MFGSTPANTVNKTVTVTDPNAPSNPLGTAGPASDDPSSLVSQDFHYSKTFSPPASGCVTVNNIATIIETGQNASASVKNCNTGALTMGFWQNKNGQALITGADQTALKAFLTGYNPFKDDTGVNATYITNVIKAANASGASMNAMLKAQMLSTALDVYFSDPALGGNKIGAPAPVGGVTIDLTHVCSNPLSCTTFINAGPAFGGANSLNVSEILSYESGQSNSGGSAWYGQVKATQELAKDTNDAINNQVVSGP